MLDASGGASVRELVWGRDLHMAQAAAIIRQQAALYLALYLARAAIGWADSIRRRALSLGTQASGRSTRAVMLAAAAGTLAMIGYQNTRHATPMRYQSDGQEPGGIEAAIEAVRNETIVFRQDVPIYRQPNQTEALDDPEDEADGATNYTRTVQTVRIFNPDPVQNTGTDGARLSDSRSIPKNDPSSGPTGKPMYRGEGIASWYGSDFHGHKTANGERYDMNGISAAHRTMPLPSYARVTNLDNGRSIIVRVNNRGPYVRHRIIDVSTGAAKALDFYKKGTTRVRVEFVGRAPTEGSDDRMLLATLRTGTPAPAPSEVMVASAKALPAKLSDEKEPRSASGP